MILCVCVCECMCTCVSIQGDIHSSLLTYLEICIFSFFFFCFLAYYFFKNLDQAVRLQKMSGAVMM